jgi:hypothetical protein
MIEDKDILIRKIELSFNYIKGSLMTLMLTLPESDHHAHMISSLNEAFETIQSSVDKL